MAYQASDAVANVASGADDGSGGDVSALIKRLPFLQRFAGANSQPAAQPGTSDVAGAGDAGAGAQGAGKSNTSTSASAPTPTPTPSPTNAGTQENAFRDLGTSIPDDKAPELAPQGGSNPFVHALARMTGYAGAQPKSGQPYEGPETGTEKRAKIGNFFSAAGRTFMGAAGTPAEREFAISYPLEKRKADAMIAYRSGLLGIGAQNAATKGRMADVAAERAGNQRYGIDVRSQLQQQKLGQEARLRGYVTDDTTGELRPMNASEIASDPILSQHQELQKAMMDQRQAEADLRYAQNDPTSPVYRQKQQAYELMNRRLGIELEKLGLQTRAENFKEGSTGTELPDGRMVALRPDAQKTLMETEPVKAQVQDLINKLEPMKHDNTPGRFAIPRALYTIGIHSDDNDLAGSLSEVELGRVVEAARVMKGSSRAMQALELALKHTPSPLTDSPAQMHAKLTNIKAALEEAENAAYTYGAKSGAVPTTAGGQGYGAAAGGPGAPAKRNKRYNPSTGQFE